MPQWDATYDFVIVGSGAAGLTAAITASDAGLRCLLIEKMDVWGGTSAYSGGNIWIPNNHLMARAGIEDSPQKARQYLDAIIGEPTPASSSERRDAYIEHGPLMVRYLEEKGFRWMRTARYPDYYPEKEGGMVGRSLEGVVISHKILGPWADTQATRMKGQAVAIQAGDAAYLPLATRTLSGFWRTARLITRSIGYRLRGSRPCSMGQSLTGQLMAILQRSSTDIWLETPLKSLIEDEGRIVGLVVDKAGQEMRIEATYGVMLTAGGFAQNPAYRQQYQPIGNEFTSVSPGDTGDAIIAGTAVQAAVALMDDAWWGPTVLPPQTVPMFSVWERSMPGCIIVNTAGKRIANESTSYVDVGHAMLEATDDVKSNPFWLIMDGYHRKRYLFGRVPGGRTPPEWLDTGFMVEASSLDKLAKLCQIDAAGLQETVQQFNRFAKDGVDADFQRGDSVYDNYYGDPRITPNPNLAPLENPPFYATKIWPGDLGTKGGLLTDEFARVLKTDGTVIPNLYAAGNTSATVMGGTYAGAGATLGPAMTFSYIGANHASNLAHPKQR